MDMKIWFLIGASFVFFMQAGFAMVEAGFTRAKNAGNIIMKNLMDFCIGTVAFLLLGYSFLLGTDVGGFIGWGATALDDFTTTDWSGFVFNLVFCATAATIVSGAMAERTKFISYCVYSFFISLIVYPIEAHWVWGGGWLSQIGFIDFAGSACIHTVGGVTALIGAKMLGPRIGKYDKDGNPRAILGHSITIGSLGVFILWFGWYGFNGAAASDTDHLSYIFMTTTIAPAIATCVTMIATWIKYGKPDVSMSLNGSLAGLVAITAGCDSVDVVGSIIIGIVAGLLVPFVVWLLDYKLKIDDPVGAVAVHCANGIWGTIAVGLFAYDGGLFYGYGPQLLITQLTGIIAIIAWTAVTMTIIFICIKKIFGLRVTPEEEIMGLDKMEHGLETAYAGFAMENELDGAIPTTVTGTASIDEAVPVEVNKTTRTVKEGLEGKITKVTIITKSEKFDALKAAMDAIGIQGMTVTRVSGCGVQKGQTTYYRGAKVDMQLLPKLKAEIIVSKVPVQDVVDAARKVLYTGTMGDGKIFIYDVENVIRISTGEQGIDALQNYEG